MTSTTTTRLAHQVVPYPEPGPGIVRDMARYHAARAWGFWLTASDPTRAQHVQATQMMLAEFQLAVAWNHLHYVDSDRGDFEAKDLAEFILDALVAPETLGREIQRLCTAVAVEFEEIGPYMAGPARTSASDPTLGAVRTIVKAALPEIVLATLYDTEGDRPRWVMAHGHHDRDAFRAAAVDFLDIDEADRAGFPAAEMVVHCYAVDSKGIDNVDVEWVGVTESTPGAFAVTLLDLDSEEALRG